MAEGRHDDGWIAFATIVAGTAGVANIMFGVGWLFSKEAFPNQSLIYASSQQWGWALVIFGLLQVIATFMLLARKNSGRIFAIAIAVVSMLAWILWAGQLPFAGTFAMVLDVLVIYGLSVSRGSFA